MDAWIERSGKAGNGRAEVLRVLIACNGLVAVTRAVGEGHEVGGAANENLVVVNVKKIASTVAIVHVQQDANLAKPAERVLDRLPCWIKVERIEAAINHNLFAAKLPRVVLLLVVAAAAAAITPLLLVHSTIFTGRGNKHRAQRQKKSHEMHVANGLDPLMRVCLYSAMILPN